AILFWRARLVGGGDRVVAEGAQPLVDVVAERGEVVVARVLREPEEAEQTVPLLERPPLDARRPDPHLVRRGAGGQGADQDGEPASGHRCAAHPLLSRDQKTVTPSLPRHENRHSAWCMIAGSAARRALPGVGR